MSIAKLMASTTPMCVHCYCELGQWGYPRGRNGIPNTGICMGADCTLSMSTHIFFLFETSLCWTGLRVGVCSDTSPMWLGEIPAASGVAE